MSDDGRLCCRQPATCQRSCLTRVIWGTTRTAKAQPALLPPDPAVPWTLTDDDRRLLTLLRIAVE